MNNALCAEFGDRLLINMATSFRISCVTRSTDASNSQQLLVVVKLVALAKSDQDRLFEELIERQQKQEITIDDLLQQMSSGIRSVMSVLEPPSLVKIEYFERKIEIEFLL